MITCDRHLASMVHSTAYSSYDTFYSCSSTP